MEGVVGRKGAVGCISCSLGKPLRGHVLKHFDLSFSLKHEHVCHYAVVDVEDAAGEGGKSHGVLIFSINGKEGKTGKGRKIRKGIPSVYVGVVSCKESKLCRVYKRVIGVVIYVFLYPCIYRTINQFMECFARPQPQSHIAEDSYISHPPRSTTHIHASMGRFATMLTGNQAGRVVFSNRKKLIHFFVSFNSWIFQAA